jgi:hypothetical protein
MVETDGYSVGHLRIKYLDLANMAFAQNNYIQADGYIKSFLDTIKDGSKAAEIITREFDRISNRKKVSLEELTKSTENLGYLEQKDLFDEGRTSIEINSIHDRKVVCWMVAQKEGLFFD